MLEVNGVSDKIVKAKIEVKEDMVNKITACAPHVGCNLEEKNCGMT